MSSRYENKRFQWECPLTKSGKRSAHSTCAKAFAEEMGFRLIDTSNDGNCFFYTLSKFGKRANYEPLMLDTNERNNVRLLREQLVDYIEDNLEQYIDFLINTNENNENNENNEERLSPENQIRKLRRDGEWASSVGDLVPFAGANAFGINIDLYNILVLPDRDVIELNEIRSNKNTNVTVSIMRVREGHFQLLWKVSNQSNQSNKYNQSNKSAASSMQNKEVIRAARLAVEAAQIAVDAVKKTKMSKGMNLSSESKLNQMIQNLNQLSISSQTSSIPVSIEENRRYPRRSTRSTRSTGPTYNSTNDSNKLLKTKKYGKRNSTKKKSRSPSQSFSNANNNNNEMKRAIEESLRYQ
jgi:hypothetical protein